MKLSRSTSLITTAKFAVLSFNLLLLIIFYCKSVECAKKPNKTGEIETHVRTCDYTCTGTIKDGMTCDLCCQIMGYGTSGKCVPSNWKPWSSKICKCKYASAQQMLNRMELLGGPQPKQQQQSKPSSSGTNPSKPSSSGTKRTKPSQGANRGRGIRSFGSFNSRSRFY